MPLYSGLILTILCFLHILHIIKEVVMEGDENNVRKYIKEIKIVIKEHGIFFVQKAQDEIIQLGINTTIAKEIISKLEIKDYIKGPIDDDDKRFRQFKVWIFGIEPINGVLETYIKLSDRRDNQRVVCLSFHTAKSSMKHPFIKCDKIN